MLHGSCHGELHLNMLRSLASWSITSRHEIYIEATLPYCLMENVFKKELLLADKAITIGVIFLLGVFKPDYLLIATFLLLVPYLLLTKRKNLLIHLAIATIIALIWTSIMRKEYLYNQNFIVFMGINIYTLCGWSLGLFAAYVLYSHYVLALKPRNALTRVFMFIAVYWILLIFSESVAYHFFDIKNLQAAAYPGLPLCNCIHAKPWMQAAYLLLGPLFFLVCKVIGIERKK